MELSFFKRRSILKRTHALELIPVCCREYQTEEDGNITLLVPKFKNDKIAKLLSGKRSRYFFIHLDEIGSRVWVAIDGGKNVGDICASVKAAMGDDFPQAEQRVHTFMARLYNEKHITFKQLLAPAGRVS
jgi:hypothetical protein